MRFVHMLSVFKNKPIKKSQRNTCDRSITMPTGNVQIMKPRDLQSRFMCQFG